MVINFEQEMNPEDKDKDQGIKLKSGKKMLIFEKKDEETPAEKILKKEEEPNDKVFNYEQEIKIDDKDKDKNKDEIIKLKSNKRTLLKKVENEEKDIQPSKQEEPIEIKKLEEPEVIIIEDIIEPNKTKKIIKKGNKLIQKLEEKEPNKDLELIEEIILINGDDNKDKNKQIIKRTILNKNRVIDQLLENEDKIISQNESITKRKQKKGITKIIEEHIIPSQNKINQYIINKNQVTEEELSIDGNNKNQISEKKYPITEKILNILSKLNIDIENPEEQKEEEKIIAHGNGEEDKKEEKKSQDKKEEEKKENSGAKKVKKTEEKIQWISETDFIEGRGNKVVLPHKWRTHPRTYGKDSRACRVCNNTHGLIRKYGLNICRKCFRERANLIGFKQTKWVNKKIIQFLLIQTKLFLIDKFGY